jgi:hypothetical protein
MKFYLIKYVGYGEHDYREDESARREFGSIIGAVSAMQEVKGIGEEKIYEALQYSFSEQIYWVSDIEGYAVATEFEVDPIDG